MEKSRRARLDNRSHTSSVASSARAPFSDDMSSLLTTYTTPQLALIESFLLRCIDILKRNTEEIATPPALAPTRAERPPR